MLDSIFQFDNNDIFIPLKFLEEIDKHKKRQDSVGTNARRIIRTLDDLRVLEIYKRSPYWKRAKAW